MGDQMKKTLSIFQSLGLVYEKNQLPIIESSVEPNGGVLNIERALDDNPECWDNITQGSTQLEKKTIILNCNITNRLKDYSLKKRIISKLIEDGFDIYIKGVNGLTRLQDSIALESALANLIPISPAQERAELTQLKATRDRVELLDDEKLNEFCAQILKSPDVFFYFINFLEIPDLFDWDPAFSGRDVICRDYHTGIEWSHDVPSDLDRVNDWSSRHKAFEKRVFNANESVSLTPQFLPLADATELNEEKRKTLFLEYLLNHYPDALKKIRFANLANTEFNLISFLNHSESLLSLSLPGSEVSPGEDEQFKTTSLRHLDLNHTTMPDEVFSDLLSHSPNLMSLSVPNNHYRGESDFTLGDTELLKLESITLGEVYVTINKLNALLKAAPNLGKLIGESVDIPDSELLHLVAPLIQLKEIKIKHSFQLKQIYYLMNNAPNLEVLDLFGINNGNSDKSLFVKQHDFKALKKIVIKESTFTVDQLISFIEAAPDLCELDIQSCYLCEGDILKIQANSLPKLTHFNSSDTEHRSSTTYFHSSQLRCFLSAAPNLQSLGIAISDNMSTFIQSLEPDSLLALNKVTFSSDRITVSDLIHFLKIAPHLKTIEIPIPDKTTEIAINWFKQSYPHIALNYFSPSKPQEQGPGFNFENLSPALDGQIGKHNKLSTLPARKLFKSKEASQPHVSAYHLYSQDWDAEHKKFIPVIPQELNLQSIHESLQSTNQQVEEVFNALEVSKQYSYGQISLTQPELNQWIQLPALSLNDGLVNYGTSIPDSEIKRDKLSGYYFIKFNKATPSCLINYIIKPGENRDETLINKVPVAHLEWLSACSFSKSGKLVDSIEYQKLLELDHSQRVQALAAFCRFEETDAFCDIDGDVINILNGLIKLRAGVCRHRARLFVAMADSLGIKASLINNDVHEFVRIDDSHHSYTVDLGGGEAHIIDLPMPAISDSSDQNSKAEQIKSSVPQLKENASKIKERVIPLAANNRFQTWNNAPIEASDGEALVALLTAPEAASRQWLIFKDNQGIETLHQLSNLGQNSFFSRDLDSLKLDSMQIKEGKDQRVESPICQFLKAAASNPNESFTWYINWSDPKARHVGLNSVIDNEGRRLDGLNIPSNVRIVVVTDKVSAAKMGDDFYSRFDAISQAPEIPPIKSPEITLNKPIQEQDILFPSPLNWESVLVGRHSFDNGVLGIIPGALLNASISQSNKLTLQNAPLEDPRFLFFINELMMHKRFFFNGDWHYLSKDFHFDFATPDLSTFPAIIKPVEVPKNTRIVNQSSFPLFFNQYQISENQTLKPLPGFLVPDLAINLIVTDHLTDIQWYTLLKEANNKKCALTINAVSNVSIPEPLKAMVTKIEPLQSKNQLIHATDLDDAEEQCKVTGTIIINVDDKTTFNHLFYHISLKNHQFIGQETGLLQAIKSGNPVIFKGTFSVSLAQQLESLFIETSSFRVNCESILAKNITLITDDLAPFKAIHATKHVYNPEADFNRINTISGEHLKKTYQKLKLTPCHSHFSDLPNSTLLHPDWVEGLIKRLEWRAGTLPDVMEPTSPETVMNYLEQHPFVFLTSKTGAGKSYFVQKTLRDYSINQNKPVTIYHEFADLKKWLQHEDESQPILFFDEANIANEHYGLFDAVARGEKEFWYEGVRYPLKKHKIIFAGNPAHYEGRFEPDLFKHYPNYLPFQGQPLAQILNPLLGSPEPSPKILELIEHYYGKAQDAGLNITPRNAQMMCLRFFILKESQQTKLMPDEFLMRYAILNEISTLSLDKESSNEIRQDIKQTNTWQEDKTKLSDGVQPPSSATGEQFIWTASRHKVAYAIETLLLIRDKKLKGLLNQELGINGLILEGEPGLGKSQLVSSMLQAKGIPFVSIPPTDPKSMQAKLLEAFHNGDVVVIDEFNTMVHEQLLNALLSGYDLEGKPPKKPGFCLIGTQNPTAFQGRQPLSKALDNRLMHLQLKHYKMNEFKDILTKKFNLSPEDAEQLTTEYMSARKHAKQQGLFPPPNPRNILKNAEEEQTKVNTAISNQIK
jgi:hypothetical protein